MAITFTDIVTTGGMSFKEGMEAAQANFTALEGVISTDGTLADNSDDAIPTEKAVKTYAAPVTDVIKGDGTAGRKMIGIYLVFTGEDDNTARLDGFGVWNHNGNFGSFGGGTETCDLGSTSVNGYWSLDADGDTATLIAEVKCLLAGVDFLHVVSAVVVDQNTTGILHVYPAVSGGNITLTFSDGSSGVVDLTVASRIIKVSITAIISA